MSVTVPKVSSKEELSALIKNSDVSYVDYQFGERTFSLGVISKPTDKLSPVYYIEHNRSLTMPDPLRQEIKAAIPNADFIDHALALNKITNPILLKPRETYSDVVAHQKVQEAVEARLNKQARLTEQAEAIPKVSVTTGGYGFFSRKKPIPNNQVADNKQRTLEGAGSEGEKPTKQFGPGDTSRR